MLLHAVGPSDLERDGPVVTAQPEVERLLVLAALPHRGLNLTGKNLFSQPYPHLGPDGRHVVARASLQSHLDEVIRIPGIAEETSGREQVQIAVVVEVGEAAW